MSALKHPASNVPHSQTWRRAAQRALVSGSAASVLSGLALALCSEAEQDRPAAALNGPSQWVWGEEAAYRRDATLRHTLIGYAIHHAMSIFWATLHERQFDAARKSIARHCVEGATTALTAYVVDYHIAPRRLRPGFRKHLGPTSLFVVYAAFAAGLVAASAMRRGSRPTCRGAGFSPSGRPAGD